MATLAIDVGTDIVGILTYRGKYSAYRRYKNDVAIRRALKRISTADVLVTFLGTNFNDLIELGTLAGLKGPLPLQGILREVRRICYINGYCGMKLSKIYERRCGSLPEFSEPDPYVRSNRNDCFMTLELYKAWERGELALPDAGLEQKPRSVPNRTTNRAKGPTT